MRIIYSIFLLFLLTAGVSAQGDSSASSGLQVLDKNWRVEIPSSELENEDPFRHNNEAKQMQQDIKENMRQNEIRARAGLTPEEPPKRVRPNNTNSAPKQPLAVYFYKVKVKNTGVKAIRAVIWEYIFFEQGTNAEVGRRRSVNKTAISPGKTKYLVLRSASPPTSTINAAHTGKKLRDRYSEQIVIQTIEYADGSKWQSGAASIN